MGLAQRISDDMKAALLGGNRFEGDTLRNLKAAILNEEVARGKRDDGLADADIEQLIGREIKKRRESISLYQANGRPELAEPEQAEIDILARYLPEPASEAELQHAIDTAIAALPSVSPAQMGQVIGAVKAQFGSRADGALLARLTKQAIANSAEGN